MSSNSYFQRQIEAGSLRLPEQKLAGVRLLLVEDDEENREVTAEMLSHSGALVAMAAGGEEAVAMAQQAGARGEAFDVVVMDIFMPGFDGLMATRALRGSPVPEIAQVPVIALSANVSSKTTDDAFAAGMNAFLRKPVHWDQLVEEIQRQTKRA